MSAAVGWRDGRERLERDGDEPPRDIDGERSLAGIGQAAAPALAARGLHLDEPRLAVGPPGGCRAKGQHADGDEREDETGGQSPAGAFELVRLAALAATGVERPGRATHEEDRRAREDERQHHEDACQHLQPPRIRSVASLQDTTQTDEAKDRELHAMPTAGRGAQLRQPTRLLAGPSDLAHVWLVPVRGDSLRQLEALERLLDRGAEIDGGAAPVQRTRAVREQEA
jgi:hypothetical protein